MKTHLDRLIEEQPLVIHELPSPSLSHSSIPIALSLEGPLEEGVISTANEKLLIGGDDSVMNPLHRGIHHPAVDNLKNNYDGENKEDNTTRASGDVDAHETNEWARDIFQISGGSDNKELAMKQLNQGRTVLALLFVLGLTAGLVNGVIIMANGALCTFQAQLVKQGGYFGIGLLYFLLTMVSSVTLACLCCKYGAREAAGSGLPEFKYLLASELTRGGCEKLVSRRIFLFKVIGLIFSVGGGLSVGSEGPLVHTASCIAHLLMKYVVWFDEILDSPSLTKQILSASAAVGVSSAFNAPVGGLLFSVEVTASFYLVGAFSFLFHFPSPPPSHSLLYPLSVPWKRPVTRFQLPV